MCDSRTLLYMHSQVLVNSYSASSVAYLRASGIFLGVVDHFNARYILASRHTHIIVQDSHSLRQIDQFALYLKCSGPGPGDV